MSTLTRHTTAAIAHKILTHDDDVKKVRMIAPIITHIAILAIRAALFIEVSVLLAY
jgi:hypothetical protein